MCFKKDESQSHESFWDRESFLHSCAHIVGALAPFLLVLIVCIFSTVGNIIEFLEEGDFCLFSTAILTPAAYTFSKYRPRRVTSNTSKYQRAAEILWPISIVLIIISSVLFVLIYISNNVEKFEIHSCLILLVSTIFLLASFIIYYYSRFIEREIIYDEVKINQSAENEFEEDYEQLN